MLNKNLIQRKLTLVAQYLNELEPLIHLSKKDFLDNYLHYRTAERNLQLIIDTAVEVNSHLIIEHDSPPPQDYYDSFIKLGSLHIIRNALAKKLAPSAGLRNRLVHEYESINMEELHKILKQDIQDYKKYCREILNFLSRGN